jgi:uncharacterized protein (DUF2267 family)
MEYERFVAIVDHEGGDLGRDTAERAAQATLRTLAERLSPSEARDLIDEIPGSGPWLFTESDPEPIDFDEFLRRVAEREGADERTAEEHARAVFAAIGLAVSPDELDDLVAELPEDFEPLIAEAERRFDRLMSADEFLRRVGERTDLPVYGARRVTDAVLETLAERIAPREVDELIGRLPLPLHAALKRGRAAAPESPRRMSRDQFLERVAEREGASAPEAYEHVRAVFRTLREGIAREDLADLTAQLPPDYGPLWASG